MAKLKMMLTERLQAISVLVSFCLSLYSLVVNLPLPMSQSSNGEAILRLRRRCRNLFRKFSLLQNFTEVQILTMSVIINCVAVIRKNRPNVQLRVSPVYSVKRGGVPSVLLE